MSLGPELVAGLKRHDPDRYRAALFAPQPARDDLITLYAFYYQIAKVHEVASEPMIAQIRLQWWRDAVDEIYTGKTVRSHEVATPLAEMLLRTKLDRFSIDQLIEGRERDLVLEPLLDAKDAERYVDDTAGRLMSLAAELCGAECDVTMPARAWGYCGLARTGLLEIGDTTLLRLAGAAYLEAKNQSYPDLAMPAITYVTLVPGYLERIGGEGERPYSLFARQMRLMRAVIAGRL